jgi:hypothetical protein
MPYIYIIYKSLDILFQYIFFLEPIHPTFSVCLTLKLEAQRNITEELNVRNGFKFGTKIRC